MYEFKIRKFEERDIDEIIKISGGGRAHLDEHSRKKIGADYKLDEIIIELKMLEEEAFNKPIRQSKIADLFSPGQKDRPVIVIDRERLSEKDRRKYDQILEGPVKNAVKKSSKQLKQSRSEHLNSKASLLFIINNGYTELDHDLLVEIVERRVRNDTSQIDGVIVSGCYLYSDDFDSFGIFPFDYIPISTRNLTSVVDKLKQAWGSLSNEIMTEGLLNKSLSPAKTAVRDTQFIFKGVTYILPAPVFGKKSEFYVNGRPRKKSTQCNVPSLFETIVPHFTDDEWKIICKKILDEDPIYPNLKILKYRYIRSEFLASPIRPLILINISAGNWENWCDFNFVKKDCLSIFSYADDLFRKKIRSIIDDSKEINEHNGLPNRYIVVVTEEIGIDENNDISHIYLVNGEGTDNRVIEVIIENLRICHVEVMFLGAAYTFIEGADALFWHKDVSYVWV